MTKQKIPRQVTINLFADLLNSLSIKYPNRSKRDIANAVVACYDIVKHTHSDSLLEFTTAFESYSNAVDRKFNMTIEESIALFVKIAYQP